VTEDDYAYLKGPTKSELIAALIVVFCIGVLALGVMYTGEKYLGCAPDEERTDYHNICVNEQEAEVQIVSWLNELGGSADVNQLAQVTGYSPRLIEDLDSESEQFYCWTKNEGFLSWSTICEVNISDQIG
jgi:hypothetical protein